MAKKISSFDNTEEKIEIAVHDGKSINIVSYAFSEDIEKKMNSVVNKIVEKHNQIEMAPSIYTIIKELAINGTKANLKRLFFKEMGFSLTDEENYKAGMAEFRKQLSEKLFYRLGSIARKNELWVKINFIYDETGLRVFIRNNVNLVLLDEKRIRDKLQRSMKYDDIAKFFLENPDDTEGAGMGIALVIILIKAEGIDPGYFRIYSNPQKNETIARIEFPFSEEFVSYRDGFTEPVI